MTKKQVSFLRNVWFDSQQVGEEDLILEQNANEQSVSSMINNHFGNGILSNVLTQNVLLDTDVSKLTAGTLDGKPITPQAQPSDSNEGNQLEIELMSSLVSGRKRVKVCIIGTDYNGNLQYETFWFGKNEKQYTEKHYTKILSVIFNDLVGPTDRSFNLGGRVVVRETLPFTMSRQTTMVGQTSEPNLFFRDFFVDSYYSTLNTMLQVATQGYDVNGLGISTSYKQARKLLVNDVTTQIGQKFLAQTTNIQKVTLLMAVENTVTSSDLAWAGDLVVSIYALQSSVSSSDLVPSLAIDYSPSNLPLAQVSVNYSTLQANGIVLDGNFQPVDFIFSNTPVANGTLTVGNYYAVTVKRSGSASKCNILMPVGSDTVDNSRVTIFNGTTWVDIQEEDLWFRVSTDSVKVTDGQAYDDGQGISLTKTAVDQTSSGTIDNVLKNISFSTTLPFFGVVQAITETSQKIQDQRTGNFIDSRQQLVPKVSLVNSTELTRLKNSGDPILIGSVQDKNVKSIDASASVVTGNFYHYGMVKNQVAIKLNETNGDPQNNLYLLTSLLNGDMVNAKFIPNTSLPGTYYQVASAEVLSMKYGDINGDGVIDSNDSSQISSLLNEVTAISPSTNSYNSSTNYFTSSATVNYQIKLDSTVLQTGTGQLIVDPVDGTFSTLKDLTFNFTSLSNLLSCVIVVSGSTSNNNGTFSITSLVNSTTIRFKKVYRDINFILKTLRADINSDGYVGTDDVAYLSDYVMGVQPIPASTSPRNKIGTDFRVLLLTLESFIDRNDDYPGNATNRSTSLHPTIDVFLSDSTFANRVFTSPITFSYQKRLNWKSDLVSVYAQSKSVPSSFANQSALVVSSDSSGISKVNYPVIGSTDPGRNDFYVPSNLILGSGGQIVNPDGTYHKVDYEIGTFVLNVPVKDFTSEKSINIFTDFVADYYGNGKTRLGLKAMKFADGTYVQNPSSLTSNQVKFSVGIQAYSPDINGLSSDGYSGIIVDDTMGVYLDSQAGILRLNFSHLKEDLINLTLSTKIEVSVYLKKAGFNNSHFIVDSATMANILGLT